MSASLDAAAISTQLKLINYTNTPIALHRRIQMNINYKRLPRKKASITEIIVIITSRYRHSLII